MKFLGMDLYEWTLGAVAAIGLYLLILAATSLTLCLYDDERGETFHPQELMEEVADSDY